MLNFKGPENKTTGLYQEFKTMVNFKGRGFVRAGHLFIYVMVESPIW